MNAINEFAPDDVLSLWRRLVGPEPPDPSCLAEGGEPPPEVRGLLKVMGFDLARVEEAGCDLVKEGGLSEGTRAELRAWLQRSGRRCALALHEEIWGVELSAAGRAQFLHDERVGAIVRHLLEQGSGSARWTGAVARLESRDATLGEQVSRWASRIRQSEEDERCSREAEPQPIKWPDTATEHRDGWTCRISSAGASLRSTSAQAPFRPLAPCWIATSEGPSPSLSNAQSRWLEVVLKTLQRSECPPLDPDAERALLEHFGFKPATRTSAGPGDVAPSLDPPPFIAPDCAWQLWSQADLDLDAGLDFDSAEERALLVDWAAPTLHPATVRSFLVQPSLEALLGAGGGEADLARARRVDFLAQPAGRSLVNVEIDGDQHAAQVQEDRDRDASLSGLGYIVQRVPARDVRGVQQGATSSDLGQLESLLELPPTQGDPAFTKVVEAGVALHRFCRAVAEAVRVGFLGGDRWRIEVQDMPDASFVALREYLTMLRAIDGVLGGSVVPDVIEIGTESAVDVYEADGARFQLPDHRARDADWVSDVVIHVQMGRSPIESLPPHDGGRHVVVRGILLPSTEIWEEHSATEGDGHQPEDLSLRAEGFGLLLRSLFAKESLRESQLEALTRIAEGESTIVLLPTGAGKSMVYQLAGLTLPGCTIVVDPLRALMDDQKRSLKAHGVDRLLTFQGGAAGAEARHRGHELLAQAYPFFIYVTPERLLMPAFQDALKDLAARGLVNLIAVDEAHCVSEWGHDFRPAYLNMADTLQTLARSPETHRAPPVVALTATASQPVLRDLQVELKLDEVEGSGAVLRPGTLNRPELDLRVEIVDQKGGEELGVATRRVMTDVLAALPQEFADIPAGEFFQAHGAQTASGIVFVPHTNGVYGAQAVATFLQTKLAARKELQHRGRVRVGAYSRGAPKDQDKDEWERKLPAVAGDFIENRTPLLVATKAFGMGIDKPNIRYVIHVGVPGAIESYYQEIGRAGRDRQRSVCVLVMSVGDRESALKKLDVGLSMDELQKFPRPWPSDADDIDRMMFFFFNNHAGVDVEVEDIIALLGNDGLGDLKGASQRRIGFQEPRGKKRAGGHGKEVAGGPRDLAHAREVALYRLRMLGVISGYQKDYSSQQFVVDVNDCDAGDVVDHLRRYISLRQPGQLGRVNSLQARLSQESAPSLNWVVSEAAQVLVGFVYETIVRGKRRQLREIWLAAFDGKDDPNRQFRGRILEYLGEGTDIADTIPALLEEERLSDPDAPWHFARWCDHLVTREQYLRERDDQYVGRELRGVSARLLADNAQHPGLLLARGLSEALDPEGDLSELVVNVAYALQSARQPYGVSDDELDKAISWLWEEPARWCDGASTAVLLAVDRFRAGQSDRARSGASRDDDPGHHRVKRLSAKATSVMAGPKPDGEVIDPGLEVFAWAGCVNDLGELLRHVETVVEPR